VFDYNFWFSNGGFLMANNELSIFDDIADAVNYVIFYTNGDANLGEFLNKRANELGYTGSSCAPEVSITLCLKGNNVLWTDKRSSGLPLYHILGDFEKFLTTDYYRVKQPLMIDDYEVKFYDNYMSVGCQKITYDKVDELIAAYNKYKQKQVDNF